MDKNSYKYPLYQVMLERVSHQVSARASETCYWPEIAQHWKQWRHLVSEARTHLTKPTA